MARRQPEAGQALLALAAGALLSLATAALLARVGVLVWRRQAEGDARLAVRLFSAWWWAAAAAAILLSGAHTWMALLGLSSLPAHLALLYLTALPLAVALWGLAFYLVYLWTGRRGALLPLAAVYGAYFVYLTHTYWRWGLGASRRGRGTCACSRQATWAWTRRSGA